jgi:hypothetical protein
MPVDYSDAVASYAAIAVIYVGLIGFTLLVVGREFRLVIVGLLTAVAAIGFGGLSLPTSVVLAPGLMKLAFLLVLGGLAQPLIMGRATGSADPVKEVEAPHASI